MRVVLPRALVLALAAILAVLPLTTYAAKKKDPDKLPITRIKDLHYGDVLFWFYQGESFEAITRLTAYDQWQRIPNHQGESQLLLGGLFLELGLHNEAGQRFERLLTANVPESVGNRAWFYLAKVWYARGYFERAEQALRSINGRLQAQLEAERQHLLANVLMQQGRFAEATELLSAWKGPDDWTAYARFNLGVALIRQNQLERADGILSAVGALASEKAELLSLRDKANLALGFAYLQAKQPEAARVALQRVRLNGPHSTKALLGMGWAEASLDRYREALNPWLELQGRNLLDSAVQEAYLAVPYAFAKLDASAQAAEYYEQAVLSFEEESVRIDDAIARVRAGTLLESILEREADGARYGWFWQLRQVPDAPESRYLYTVLAGHDFQEGLKNYRDMSYLDGTLTRWEDSLAAFADMIDTRERALALAVPQAEAILTAQPVLNIEQQRDAVRSSLEEAQRVGDVAALGNGEERDQWQRIAALEAALAADANNPEMQSLRERLRLVKGVLYWRLNQEFRARLFTERRQLGELDALLAENNSRFARLGAARTGAGENNAAFAQRLQALNTRRAELHARLTDARRTQSVFLADLAVAQLGGQKDRLAEYQIQARFSLAAIYDRAANVIQKTAPTNSESQPESQPELQPEPPLQSSPEAPQP